MLEVSNLAIRYPNQDFLIKDVSFCLKAGESLWLTGANGTGKSSLLYALCNIIPQLLQAERPGRIKLFCEDVSEVSVNRLIPDISLAFSDPRWEFFFSTPRDDMIFVLENIGLKDEEINTRINNICKRFQMKPWLDYPSYQLSSGWQKISSLAVQAVINPSLLLLDEPLNGLSEKLAELVLNWLQDYLKQGGILVIAEHSGSMKKLNPKELNLDEIK
jgi:energy-coupling factor transport system ATP-binding protein